MKTVALILTVALLAAGAAVGPAAARQGAAGTAHTQEADERPLVVNADLVTVTVTVTDGDGRHVAGLGKGAFAVTDDKVTQEVEVPGPDGTVGASVITPRVMVAMSG